MTITHDNSGTRRTQAQRNAAALIERGEFIAADTPAGQAVIDALEEAAQRVRTMPGAEDGETDGSTETLADDAPVIVNGSTSGKWAASVMSLDTTDTRSKK